MHVQTLPCVALPKVRELLQWFHSGNNNSSLLAQVDDDHAMLLGLRSVTDLDSRQPTTNGFTGMRDARVSTDVKYCCFSRTSSVKQDAMWHAVLEWCLVVAVIGATGTKFSCMQRLFACNLFKLIWPRPAASCLAVTLAVLNHIVGGRKHQHRKREQQGPCTCSASSCPADVPAAGINIVKVAVATLTEVAQEQRSHSCHKPASLFHFIHTAIGYWTALCLSPADAC